MDARDKRGHDGSGERMSPLIGSRIPRLEDEALLRGLLGNDLIEFHTERYALNFLGCVAELVPEAEIDADTLAVMGLQKGASY